MVDKVFPGQPIKASTINQVIDAATSGRVTGAPQSVYQPKEVLVKNWTQTTWGACEPFRISGQEFMFEQTESALNKFLTFGAVLRGHAITSDTPSFRIGLTKESIKPGEIGRCSVPGLMGAKVYGVGTKYVKYDSTAKRLTGTDVESEAQFALICGNNGVTAQDGMYFCFISPLAGVGGSLKAYVDAIQWNVDVNKIVPGANISFTNSDGEITIKGSYGVSITSGGQSVNITRLIAGSNIGFSNNGSALTITGPNSTEFVDSYIPATTTSARTLYLAKPLRISNESQPGGTTISRIVLAMTNRYYVTDVTCNTSGDLVVTKEMLYSE